MHAKFTSITDSLPEAVQKLCQCKPIETDSLKQTKELKGIYLFSEAGKNLYVGRTNNIQKRFRLHTNPSSQQNQATFAFRLAREFTGQLSASYRPGSGSRKGLIEDPNFLAAFNAAKARIRAMEFRFVEEPDPIRQTLLEVYCAMILDTPYNSFQTS